MADQKILMQKSIFLFLMVIVLVLGSLNVAKAKGLLIPDQPSIKIYGDVIDLDSMNLEQKIAQMIVVHGGLWNLEPWRSMELGGIHLFAMQDSGLYKDIISKFQRDMQIPFLVTVDLEGCWNPFSNFKTFKAVSEIDDIGDAFKKGREEGQFLKELGFSVNFAPVVDLNDEIWKCRSFPGDEEEISELAEAYILGLQKEGIIATAKHYPGKTLVVKDPHKQLVVADISQEDIYPYSYLSERGDVASVMVSHIITSGAVNSAGVPSVVSESAINGLKNKFNGLIISDEINMLGLKDFYPTLDEMYVAVFKAGNDIILNFNEDPNEIYRMIQVVRQAVEDGVIFEEQIDGSVKKILEAKGFRVA
jgi:beta-N-acetylhexosaminidase